MGAKDKKNGTKEPAAKEPAAEKVELTEEQQTLYEDALVDLRVLVDNMHSAGAPIREWALALTRIEEAEMWLDRGFEMLGIEPALDQEDDDEEDESAEDEEEE